MHTFILALVSCSTPRGRSLLRFTISLVSLILFQTLRRLHPLNRVFDSSFTASHPLKPTRYSRSLRLHFHPPLPHGASYLIPSLRTAAHLITACDPQVADSTRTSDPVRSVEDLRIRIGETGGIKEKNSVVKGHFDPERFTRQYEVRSQFASVHRAGMELLVHQVQGVEEAHQVRG